MSNNEELKEGLTETKHECCNSNYKTFKAELDVELNKAADGFIKIGYMLRVAEDTDILSEGGYKTVAEFADAEYGMSKDVVSRYININKRYSQNGYSPELAERYRGFGMAKLAEMLTLPGSIVEQIPEDLTKAEIREIKKEYAEEQQISDIEVMIEKAEEDSKATENLGVFELENNMERLIYDYMHAHKEEWKGLAIRPEEFKINNFIDYIVPNGSRVIISRIPGTGKCMMSIKGKDEAIELINMRSNEKESYTWDQLARFLIVIGPEFNGEGFDYAHSWKKVYGEEWQEQKKTEISKETDKQEVKKRKESKVFVVKKKKKDVHAESNIKAPEAESRLEMEKEPERAAENIQEDRQVSEEETKEEVQEESITQKEEIRQQEEDKVEVIGQQEHSETVKRKMKCEKLEAQFQKIMYDFTDFKDAFKTICDKVFDYDPEDEIEKVRHEEMGIGRHLIVEIRCKMIDLARVLQNLKAQE